MRKSYIAVMVSALMMLFACSVPAVAGGLGGVSDTAPYSALTFKHKKHESVVVADVSLTRKTYSGGIAENKEAMSCVSCHVDIKKTHKTLKITDWRKTNDLNGYRAGLVLFQPGKVFQPG